MEDPKYKFENGQFVNRVSGEAIPDDEPVFIFRARDWHAYLALERYWELVADEHHGNVVRERINEFRQFWKDHPERMKEPDTARHYRSKSDPVD